MWYVIGGIVIACSSYLIKQTIDNKKERERIEKEKLEKKARTIDRSLRTVVTENENIAQVSLTEEAKNLQVLAKQQ